MGNGEWGMGNGVMKKLHVYNTRSRRKELFEPMESGRVGMYVCGITAYDYCHLGHARCYVAFDVIYRYLKYLGYQVTYIQNITDLDDKLIAKAQEEGGEGDIKSRVADIARRYTEAYFKDTDRLNIIRAGPILPQLEIFRRCRRLSRGSLITLRKRENRTGRAPSLKNRSGIPLLRMQGPARPRV